MIKKWLKADESALVNSKNDRETPDYDATDYVRYVKPPLLR